MYQELQGGVSLETVRALLCREWRSSVQGESSNRGGRKEGVLAAWLIRVFIGPLGACACAAGPARGGLSAAFGADAPRGQHRRATATGGAGASCRPVGQGHVRPCATGPATLGSNGPIARAAPARSVGGRQTHPERREPGMVGRENAVGRATTLLIVDGRAGGVVAPSAPGAVGPCRRGYRRS